MTKKLTFSLALACVVTGAAAAGQVTLILDTNLPDPVPQLVKLHDAAKCEYIGNLRPAGGDKGGMTTQFLNQGRGYPMSWSIEVTRKICGNVESPVALVVPLRHLETEPGYDAGSAVIAYSVK